ncbi:hypothetical protein ACE01N_08045 [Saccharicrinis sp. FJH2]|uniref:hypothetical protein n=1 Tax=Saccharicrinis sp. FJH65 TaxID=3344659 RepID=UPI0035F46D59
MKLKVVIQLVIVLVLGFFIGFLTNSSIVSKKIKNYSWRRGEVVFWTRTLDEIHATQEQKDDIMPIVFKYSDKGHQVMRDAMKEIEPLWEEMEEEIAPILTQDQLKVVEAIKKRRIERFRDRTKNQGRNDRWRNAKRDSTNMRNRQQGPPPPPPSPEE